MYTFGTVCPIISIFSLFSGPDAAPLAEDVEYPELSGSETSGPESSGLRASGPKSSGLRASGPESSGLRASGPESSGLRASLTGDPGGSEETDPEVTGSGKAKSASLEVKPVGQDEGQQRVTKKPRGPGVSNSYLPPVQVSNFVHSCQSYFFVFPTGREVVLYRNLKNL
jgi:hypothetical protein